MLRLSHDTCKENFEQKKQLFINISQLVLLDKRTGIQRATRSLLLALLEIVPHNIKICPVYANTTQQGFFYANRFINILCGEDLFPTENFPVTYSCNDIFIGGMDFSPLVEMAQKDTLIQMHQCGVKIYFIVYDLIPCEYPQYCRDPIPHFFPQWIEYITQFDGALCCSHATAVSLSNWVNMHLSSPKDSFHIAWFHEGCDIENSAPTKGLPPEAPGTLEALEKRPTLLIVGTVEPRKGIHQLFSAIDILWKKGLDINLVVVGKQGWKTEKLEEIFMQHPERKKRLFRLEAISDEYLSCVYKKSTVVIMASEAEGFGLPIIEAARYEKPLILRDIPVFREIAGEHAFYFSGLSPESLAMAIEQWFMLYHEGKAPSTKGMPILTWKESAQMLLDKLPL